MSAIKIVRPYRVPVMALSEPLSPIVPIREVVVELRDPMPLREYLHNLAMQCAEQAITPYGVVFSAPDYFTLTEHLRPLLVRACEDARERREDVFIFEGIRILLDPMRDDGEPLPLFDETNALDLYVMRKDASALNKCVDKEKP